MNLTEILEKSVEAGRALAMADNETIDKVLLALADESEAQTAAIVAANEKDQARMSMQDPTFDRLVLNPERIRDIAADLRAVAALPSPVGRVLDRKTRPNGLAITKVSVPFGVIGIIYEARPNVTFDVFSICLKSGNACILKGGSDAADSNEVIVGIIHGILKRFGLAPEIATLLPNDRAATAALLGAVGYVDLIIPRGSQGLINFVRDNARVPVIETGAGIVHVYFHTSGDAAKAAAIINNAKTRRVSVCNALDGLVVDRARLADLPALCEKLAASNVIVYADTEAYAVLDGHYPAALLQHATSDSFGTEFLDYKMSVKTVGGIDDAIVHVTRHSSKHSETIVATDRAAIDRYLRQIDAACVYANASTAFTDGAQFGLGAEIGISTQKLHARGPMALEELTGYKYIIEGDGQIRS
ncbi:MAG: glutamate-5-semialdehyde dehydrogenase [Rikenellaceae bacterium]|jgi:glutamate-5-semialdehyde dehydrogenase|nr:glutamate-5-semialdehyde dehydrogenase [Rikenellaceae bacterium]